MSTWKKDEDLLKPGDQPDSWTGTVVPDPLADAATSPARIVGLEVGTEVDVRLQLINGNNAVSEWVNAGSATPEATTVPTKARNVKAVSTRPV